MTSVPSVLLLHGQPGLGRDWSAVASHLEGRADVVAPDRPGYGANRQRASGFAGNAKAAADLLDERKLDRAVVVGHSWGGGAALAMALEFPERVTGLVLVASVGPGCFDFMDWALARPVFGAFLAFASFAALRRALGLSAGRRVLNRYLTNGDLGTSAEVFSHAGIWRPFTVEQRHMAAELPEIEARLADVAVPTVVMTGTADRVVPPATAVALADAIPGARLVEVPGASHYLPFDAPEAIAAAVTEVAGR